jgi:hypothetical protein
MTELVHRRAVGLGQSLCATLVALTLALPVRAAPAQGPTPEGPAASEAVPEEAAIRSALEAGDLTTARELAMARSAAEPSSDNLALEAEVHTAIGDYERAKAALDQAIAALPETAKDDRAALTQRRDELEERSRGVRTDEPESTHREQLDGERAERLAALAPAPEPTPEPIDQPKPRVPIVKKWYFWVTLGSIVATAGAIVGVAISSSVKEQKGNDTAVGRQPSPAGGLTLRF